MLTKNYNDALGIIFTNSYDSMIPELVAERSISSVPFASRYRLCDFIISSMVHSNISNISFMCRKNYHSLMDHLGSGAEFDLARKNGGLNIVPPFAEKQVDIYNGRVEALASLIGYLKKCKEKYVILSDSNYAFNFDFRKAIKFHAEHNADVTQFYRRQAIPKTFFRPTNSREVFYTLVLDGTRVTDIEVAKKRSGIVNYSMNISIIERTKIISLIEETMCSGGNYWSRDVLKPRVNTLNIQAYEFPAYAAQILDMKSYFTESMALLDEKNCDAMFEGERVYTKVRDDNPTVYKAGAKVKNIMAGDGCIIEGEVENSIIFRGVKIGKGAKVKNCILMQDTVVEDGASIEYVITDKDVKISKNKTLSGNDSYQVYVSKGQLV